MSQETLYFDDLKVGDTFTTGSYEVSAADIKVRRGVRSAAVPPQR